MAGPVSGTGVATGVAADSVATEGAVVATGASSAEVAAGVVSSPQASITARRRIHRPKTTGLNAISLNIATSRHRLLMCGRVVD